MLLAILLSLAVAAATPPDSLEVRHTPQNGTLPVEMGALSALSVREPFRYVGGQRFILRGVANAEQHFFVVADEAGRIARLYWIQIEEFLPQSTGAYDYSKDQVVSEGVRLFVNVRTYDAPPASGSDRERASLFLKSRGYTMPDGATRVRLVYLPETPARREVMIVYLEAGESAKSALEGELTSRATESLTLETRR
ncbi:MAG TPA: hypothetical protein VIA29_04715 [Thermoanaerobaculia bacterium]